jgi:hypothetical protein
LAEVGDLAAAGGDGRERRREFTPDLVALRADETADVREIHEGLAVDAQKGLGGQGLFPALEGAQDHDLLPADEVELGVVFAAADGGDGGDGDEAEGGAGLHEDAVVGVDAGGGRGGRSSAGKVGGGGAEAAERGGQAGGGDGFQEVIEGVDVEGADGVAVVGGDEDEVGVGGDGIEGIEAGAAAELDVEEDEVLAAAGEERAGLDEGGGFARDDDGRMGGEQAAQFEAGEGFVVDEDGAQVRRGGHTAGKGERDVRRGGAPAGRPRRRRRVMRTQPSPCAMVRELSLP